MLSIGQFFLVLPYFVLTYLLFLSYKGLKSQTLSIGRLFVVPGVLLGISLYSLIVGFERWSDLLIWAIFIVIGFLIGLAIADSWKVRANRKKLLIKIPGTPIPFYLIAFLCLVEIVFLSFCLKGTSSQIILRTFSLILSDAITGMFFGIPYALMRKFADTRHESGIKIKGESSPKKKKTSR